MEQRRITSATLIANGEAIDNAVLEARKFAFCSFGAHLNLTEFRPLSQEYGLAPILTPEGKFAKNAIRAVPFTAALRKAILIELSAQVEALLEKGIPISHFDSHHHIHTIPGLFGILKALQAKYGINKVRLTLNMYRTRQQVLQITQKALWNFCLRHFHKTITTEIFTSYEVFYNNAHSIIYSPMSVELMTHPGSSTYAAETELLRRNLERQCPFKIVMINYKEL